MTEQEINIAIANAIGLKKGTFRTFGFGHDGRAMGDLHGWWKKQGSNRRSDFVTEIPDYCNDLNEMHEAEKVLTATQFEWMWLVELPKMINQKVQPLGMDVWEIHSPVLLFHATAAQRAEAFLRTLGLWED